MNKKIPKEKIITLYQELVNEHDGRLIGGDIFKREMGISSYYWRGGYWRNWSEFQADDAARVDIRQALVEGGSRGLASRRSRWPRRFLVIGSGIAGRARTHAVAPAGAPPPGLRAALAGP